MTSIAAASPIVTLADPAVSPTGSTGGDAFAPVFAALLTSAGATTAPAGPPAPTGTSLPPGIASPGASISPIAGFALFGQGPTPRATPPRPAFDGRQPPVTATLAPAEAAPAAAAPLPVAPTVVPGGPALSSAIPASPSAAAIQHAADAVTPPTIPAPPVGVPAQARIQPRPATGNRDDRTAARVATVAPRAGPPAPALPDTPEKADVDATPSPDAAASGAAAVAVTPDGAIVATATPVPRVADITPDKARAGAKVGRTVPPGTPLAPVDQRGDGTSQPTATTLRDEPADPDSTPPATPETPATAAVAPVVVPISSPFVTPLTTPASAPRPADTIQRPGTSALPDPSRLPDSSRLPGEGRGPGAAPPSPPAPEAPAPAPRTATDGTTAPLAVAAVATGLQPGSAPPTPRASGPATRTGAITPEPIAASTAAPPAPARLDPASPAAILPALQAFGAALHRAAAAERRSPRDPEPQGVTAVAPAAALAAPAEAPPLDTTRPRWPEAMVARIEAIRDAQNAGDTRIRLHPDALGTVDVTLRQDAAGTHVRLDAVEPATRALLADARPQLQELAETRGLRLAGNDAAGTGGQGAQGWTGDRRQPASAPALPTRRPAPDPAATDDRTDTRLA